MSIDYSSYMYIYIGTILCVTLQFYTGGIFGIVIFYVNH